VSETGRPAGPYRRPGSPGATRQMEVAFVANENENVDEVPTLIEVGDFAELTQLTSRGYWIDSPWGAWWL
jgi:hypothetical protein